MEQQVVSGPFLLSRAEKPAPTHEREDRQNRLCGMADHQCRDFGRRSTDRQIVQERKQVAVVNDQPGPRARSLDRDHISFDTYVRLWRESELPLEWAFRRRSGWRTEGHTRREPASSATQGSRQESEPIEAIEQGRAPCLKIVFETTPPDLGIELGFAATRATKEFERPEFHSTFDARFGSGCAKKRAPVSQLELHIRRERVRPLDRIGGHVTTVGSDGSTD
jgi:hypothetical protein